MKLKTTYSQRGFGRIEFKDHDETECILMKSSLADEDAIRFGVKDVNPQIMASDAIKLGMDTNGQTTGWIPYHVPKEVLFTDLMHLTQSQVQELLPILQYFAEHGELPQ